MRELNAVLPNGIADPLNANIRSWCGWFPYAAFRRAIEARNLTRALTEARDLPRISLVDAAELVVLAAEQHGPSYERWSARWAARYALEEANVTLDEAQLVLPGLTGLRQEDRQASALTLIAVFASRERPDLERPVRRLLKTG
jgi:hypothetical protein